jgi:CubicO group peptidase (beta-lactamase class C family)
MPSHRIPFYLSIFAILVLSSVPPVCAGESPDTTQLASRIADVLQANLPEWVVSKDVPGAAAVVVHKDQIVWRFVYGVTSRSDSTAVTAQTIFSLQSASKCVTALGVLKAVDQGILSLDEPISSYVPDFRINSRFRGVPAQQITLRRLLSHHAGLPHEAPVGSNYDASPCTFEEHIASISSVWLQYPVGYRFSYSNLGFDLAGYIVQKQSGVAFADYMKRELLDPIGMSDSSFDMEQIIARADRAIGHWSNEGEPVTPIPVYIPMVAAGGLYVSIDDVARLLSFLLNDGRVGGRQLIDASLIRDMRTIAFPWPDQRTGYGLGIARDEAGGTYVLHHSGGGYGFTARLLLYPEFDIGFAILLNRGGLSTSGIQNVLTGIVESHAGEGSQTIAEDLPPLPANDERRFEMAGVYPGLGTIRTEDSPPRLRFNDTTAVNLVLYEEDGQLLARLENAPQYEIRYLDWTTDETRSIAVLDRETGNITYHDLERVRPDGDRLNPSVEPEWAKYAGVYESAEWKGRGPRETFALAVESGYLTINGRRCHEYKRGLFFSFDGQALDLRTQPPTYGNRPLTRRD